jgi:hypothetical protein
VHINTDQYAYTFGGVCEKTERSITETKAGTLLLVKFRIASLLKSNQQLYY